MHYQEGDAFFILALVLWPAQHYLKMLNPATGRCHIEGVCADCSTGAEELRRHNGICEMPMELT
jgi:hypothetical protein